MKKVLLLCLVFFVIPVSIHFAFNRENIDINEFRFEDFEITDYDPYPNIPAPVAV